MTVDHSRGLCHKPDRKIPLGAKVEHFEINPVNCRCCGTELTIRDYIGSSSMEVLGLLTGTCPVCPLSKDQQS